MKKPIETRIRKLEEQMAKLQEKKSEADVRLADPSIYDAAKKDELKTLLMTQAEWLEQQEALERIT